MVKKLFCILILNFMLLPFVESGTGSTGWWIFRRPQSTKHKSLTTVAAVRGDLSGVFFNPAILATMNQKEIFFITELGLAQDTFGGLLYGQPVKLHTSVGISAGVVYYDAGKETLYYIENGVEKSRTVSLQRDLLGIISYGQKIVDITGPVYFGGTLKFANSTVAELKSANAFAFDLGILFLPKENIGISLAVQNVGSATKFINKAEELPTSVWFGGSYSNKITENSYIGLGFEVPYIVKEERFLPSVGIEYSIGQFMVNLGYRFGAKDSLFHIGLGLTINKIDLGYSFIPAQYLAHTHRLSFGFRF